MPLLCSYIFDEYKAQHSQEEPSPPLGDRGMWRRRYCQRCPQQTNNGWDGGVFTIMAAEYLGLGKPWDLWAAAHQAHQSQNGKRNQVRKAAAARVTIAQCRAQAKSELVYSLVDALRVGTSDV